MASPLLPSITNRHRSAPRKRGFHSLSPAERCASAALQCGLDGRELLALAGMTRSQVAEVLGSLVARSESTMADTERTRRIRAKLARESKGKRKTGNCSG